MPNVWDAMKRHESEQDREGSSSGPAPPADESASVNGQTTAEPAEAKQAQPGSAEPKPPKKLKLSAGPSRAESYHYADLLMAYHDRAGAITENYRALRTSLLAQHPEERFSYLVTSASAGEGKTVTCMNLGIVMAERLDRQTIVIDFDMRRGRMAAMFSAPSTPGVADLLRGTAEIKDVVQETAYPNLFFMPNGEASIGEVGELVGRPELEDIVNEIRRKYDFVLLDTPPINIVADAGVLGRAAAGALLVVRMNKTRRESVSKAIRLLHAANVNIGGLVLTYQRYYIPGYLYRYA